MKWTWRDDITYWWDDWGWPASILLCTFSIIAILSYLVYQGEIRDRAEWEAFSKAHNCKAVERVQSSTQVAYDGTVYVEPAKVGYKCDDGVIYWRNE